METAHSGADLLNIKKVLKNQKNSSKNICKSKEKFGKQEETQMVDNYEKNA